MLFRCNILALVGGGRNPRYPPNKVMVWDDHQNRCIGELSFRSEVKAVRMSRERVVVVLEYKIYVYNFADLNLLHTIETASNPRGLCSLCPDSRACVLACPGLQKGHVKVELFDITRTTLVPAHESSLGYLATNLDGTRLATASERGTLVRVWDTKSGQRLHELRRAARPRPRAPAPPGRSGSASHPRARLGPAVAARGSSRHRRRRSRARRRRGAEPADIQCISFSADLLWLLVSSDHGTVHLFRLGEEAEHAAAAAAAAAAAPPASPAGAAPPNGGDGTPDNPRSNFAFLGSMLPKAITPTYFQSQWSFAQFRLPARRPRLAPLPLMPAPPWPRVRRARAPWAPRAAPRRLRAARQGSEKTLTKNICAFGPPGSHTFLVVSADGERPRPPCPPPRARTPHPVARQARSSSAASTR
jgi:hypothetical protein